MVKRLLGQGLCVMICSQIYNQASSIISITMRFYVLSIILVFLLVGGLLGKGLQVDAASVASAKFDGPSNHLRGQLRRYMPPLEHDPQDRWPILYWGAAPQDHLLAGDMIRRGIAPLCISTSRSEERRGGKECRSRWSP